MPESIQTTTITDFACELRLTPSTISCAISTQIKATVHLPACFTDHQFNHILSSFRPKKPPILYGLTPGAVINFFCSAMHVDEYVTGAFLKKAKGGSGYIQSSPKAVPEALLVCRKPGIRLDSG